MIQTEGEELDNAQKKINLGIADRVSVLMKIENISEQEAIEKIAEIDARKANQLLTSSGVINDNSKTQDQQNGSQSDNQPT